MRHSIALALVLLLAPAARAEGGKEEEEEVELASDRPDATDSTYTVRPGSATIETGFLADVDRRAGVRSVLWTTPTELKFGIVQSFELALLSNGFVYDWEK